MVCTKSFLILTLIIQNITIRLRKKKHSKPLFIYNLKGSVQDILLFSVCSILRCIIYFKIVFYLKNILK
jgi:hypothetical protein